MAAQFDTSINVDVNTSKALTGISRVERALDELNKDASINLNLSNREALKGLTQVEGGINKLIKGVKEFERVFGEAINPKRAAVTSRFELEQEQKALRTFTQQNIALEQQLRLAAQLGSAYDKLKVKVIGGELIRAEEARNAQKALTGTPTRKALPAAGGTSSRAFGGEQTAAVRAEAQVREALIRELQQQLAADARITAAKEKLARAAEGEVSNVVRRSGGAPPSKQKLLPAAGQTKGRPVPSLEIQAQQRAAAEVETAQVAELKRSRAERIEEILRLNRATRALAAAREKLARAAEGEVSTVTRTAKAPEPFGLLEPRRGERTSTPVGSSGGRKYQQRLQAEVDRQIRVTGKLSNEILETVAKYNKVQESADRLVKTQGRLSTEVGKAAKATKEATNKTKKATGGGGKKAGGGGAGGGLAAGIGFPLLFGSGPLSVLGGAIGSAGGFGTQILASAIGGILDQAIADVAKLGQALNPFTADVKAVTAAAGETGTAFGRLVSELEKVAGEEKALEAATAQLATIIGTEGVDALKDFGDASTELSNELSKALTALGAALAPILADITRATANAVQRSRLVRKGANDLKDDPRIQQIKEDLSNRKIGEIEAEDRIVALVKELELEEQINVVKTAQAALQAKINEQTASSLALKEQELVVAQNNGDILNEQVQTALQNIDAEKIRLKILEAQGDELKLNLAFAEAQLLAALRANRIAAATEAANRKAEAAARKAANEEKRLAREAEQAAKKEQGVQQALAQLDVEKYNTAIQLIAATQGEKAALEEQKRNTDALLLKRIEIVELSGKDVRIQEKEKELLTEKNRLEVVTINNKLQEIALQEKLNDLVAKQQVEDVQTQLNQELSGLSLGGNDETDLLQKQANRYANTLKEINNEIEIQKLLIANIPTPDKKATDAAVKQLETLEETKLAYETMLPQIAAAEQAQLRYNKAFAAISPAVNSLVSGLQDVVAGTKTAEEAFADFLRTVADQLVQTAAVMIAQYIAIGIAKAFAGLGGNKPSISDFGGGNPLGPLSGNTPLPFITDGLATGGTANGGQPYIVGENGPELFIPGVTGTVSNNDQFEAAFDAMSSTSSSSSATGEGGLGGSEVSSAFAQNNSTITSTSSYMKERAMERESQTTIGSAGSMVIETQVINNVEYATVEQMRIANAATAKKARAEVFADLKNKPSARAAVGMR